MPDLPATLEFEFLEDPPLAIVRPAGTITKDDLLGWMPKLAAEARYRPEMHMIFDVSDVSLMRRPEYRDVDGVSKVVASRPRDPDAMMAVVAPDDMLFGISRMYVAISGLDLPARRGVFRTRGEALAWIRAEGPGSPGPEG